jgi:hypothetical protein
MLVIMIMYSRKPNLLDERNPKLQNALCRAAIPQAGDLLKRMGANCPASIPSLLRGCIEAYSSAVARGNVSIASVAKKGALCLAQLSLREQLRVQSILLFTFGNAMLDVQLQLAISSKDSTAACCLLIRHLSPSCTAKGTSINEKMTEQPRQKMKDQENQSPGAKSSSDFRTKLEQDKGPTLQDMEPTLQQLLIKDQPLMHDTLDFIAGELGAAAKCDNGSIPVGKLCILLAAYSWLLLSVQRARHPEKLRPSKTTSIMVLDMLIPALHSISQALMSRNATSDLTPGVYNSDRACCLLHCAIVVSWGRLLQDQEADNDMLKDRCCKSMMEMKKFPSVSVHCDSFLAGLVWLTGTGDTLGMYNHIIRALYQKKGNRSEDNRLLNVAATFYPSLEPGLARFCANMATSALDVQAIPEASLDDNAALYVEVSVLLLETRTESKNGDDAVISRTETILKKILTDNTVFQDLICSNIAARFVVFATQFLARQSMAPHVPLITPIQIQALCMQNDISERNSGELPSRSECQLLLQLLYAFEFKHLEPKSPFAFEPRAMPFEQVLIMCRRLMSEGKASILTSRLQDQVENHLPDVFLEAQRCHQIRNSPKPGGKRPMSHQDTREYLGAAIRASIEHANPDQLASSLEGQLLRAERQLSESELCTTIVSALLSTPNRPAPYFTYALLCQDPLVVLKCPMKIWRCRGLRRITMTILHSLLETNTAKTIEESPSEESAAEMLAARNAIVVRCLLVAMVGTESGVEGFYCSMTSSFLRRLLAGQRGLVALLIKQGLPDLALDWLVDNIPESMGDSQDLTYMISDRSSLIPAERLVAADAVLRIAIAHGCSNEVEAERMAYTALTQLVNCFFLVVGPVGVPVNTLVRDGSGLDVTQISRNAAFRILRGLLKVRGRRTRLRNECGMALQKLANLCKGETVFSGVAGAVAGRRRKLLKEIFDAVMKAVNAMGSAIGSQSAAA